jgi:hypothetical protein
MHACMRANNNEYLDETLGTIFDLAKMMNGQNSANQEYTEAQHNLGVCLFHGRGITRDYAHAASLFAKAAEKDHPESTHMLGVCFQNGHGIPKDKEKALDLFRRAAGLGVEESQTKIMVMEERHTRELELSDLGHRIENIKGGFIQLQLERAATEEVTHAYKGAGFFLSNVKSETPIRARIEQAKKAEMEIKSLRQLLHGREKEIKDLVHSNTLKDMEIARLDEMVDMLQEETERQKRMIEALQEEVRQLEAERAEQREQIKELMTENTELRTVAEWAKKQRVSAIKDSLVAVVRATIKEADEREKKLKQEIEQLRARTSRPGGGGVGASDGDGGDQAAGVLRRVRRNVFLQDALMRHVIMSVRDEDMNNKVASIKEVADEAEGMEKLAYVCCEKLVEHIDTGSVLEDDQAVALRDALTRIQGSMNMTLLKAKQVNEHHGSQVRRLEAENAKLRGELGDVKTKVEELVAITEQQRTSVQAVAASALDVESAMRKVADKVSHTYCAFP